MQVKNKTKKLPNILNKEFKIFQNVQYWFLVPLIVILISSIAGIIYHVDKRFYGFVDIGIDFRGGTVLTVEMTGADILGANRDKSLSIISDVVSENGAEVVSDQNSGANTLVVRYPNTIRVEGVQEDYNKPEKTEEMLEINNIIASQVEMKFKEAYGQDITVNATAEMINATASSDLIKKAALSVGIAMLLMLIYMAFRFDFFSGVATLTTQLIDIIVMFSCIILFRIQINSTLIAALITIVSYSINNTIIIFDRVRDNVKLSKSATGKIDVQDIVNVSVKQSFRRAVFTSFTTLITISILAMVGIRSLTEFALPIIFGLLSGLYSSLLLSPSLWGLMMQAKLKNSKLTPQKYKNRKKQLKKAR